MGKISVTEEDKKVRLERAAKKNNYKTIGKEVLIVKKRRGRPPKEVKERKMNASMDDYLTGEKNEGEKEQGDEEYESDEEVNSDESDGKKKREEEAFEKRSKIKRTPDLKQRAVGPIFKPSIGRSKKMGEIEVSENHDRWEEYVKKDILEVYVNKVEEIMTAKWESMKKEFKKIMEEENEKIIKKTKEEIVRQMEKMKEEGIKKEEMIEKKVEAVMNFIKKENKDVKIIIEEEVKRNKNEVIRELRDKVVYREESMNKEIYKNKYKFIRSNFISGGNNKSNKEKVAEKSNRVITISDSGNVDKNNNNSENEKGEKDKGTVSSENEKEGEKVVQEKEKEKEVVNVTENGDVQIENNDENRENSDDSEPIKFGPQPLSEEEWKEEKDKRKKKEGNVKMYGAIPMSWMNKYELTKGVENIINEKIYIKGGTRKNNALIINCGSWRDAKKIMDKKKEMEEKGLSIEYDMTEREKQVQWWLAKVASEGRKEGVKMRERYQGMEREDNIMSWNEREAKLEFFRKRERRDDGGASTKEK